MPKYVVHETFSHTKINRHYRFNPVAQVNGTHIQTRVIENNNNLIEIVSYDFVLAFQIDPRIIINCV